jgi:DNA (cytosine-5)-methyltransferase 1
MDLFSGIGGFSLGLKRAGGFKTVAYCEIEPYCQDVLRARMLDGSLDTAPICRDVRVLDGRALAGVVDLVCGGFPCQDISQAGLGVGIDGARSGLWREMHRIIREARPRYVLVENVPALARRGLDRVLGDLAAIGYDAEWDCIPASAVGANHTRDRIWILAYPHGEGQLQQEGVEQEERGRAGDGGQEMAHANGSGRSQQLRILPPERGPLEAVFGTECRRWWSVEPQVGRVVDGLPGRVGQLETLGNAVVPQVVEWIGCRIMKDFSSERRNDA